MDIFNSKFKLDKNNGASILFFIILCAFNGNFKDDKKLLIYILYRLGFINLRKHPVIEYTGLEVCRALDKETGHKTKKNELYEFTGLSKNKFKKEFRDFFNDKGWNKRRSFSYEEIYHILNHWQGEGKWIRFCAFKKSDLISLFGKRDYKDLAQEFDSFLLNAETYKSSDKLSPKIVKDFAKHLGMDEDEIVEKLDVY